MGTRAEFYCPGYLLTGPVLWSALILTATVGLRRDLYLIGRPPSHRLPSQRLTEISLSWRQHQTAARRDTYRRWRPRRPAGVSRPPRRRRRRLWLSLLIHVKLLMLEPNCWVPKSLGWPGKYRRFRYVSIRQNIVDIDSIGYIDPSLELTNLKNKVKLKNQSNYFWPVVLNFMWFQSWASRLQLIYICWHYFT